MPVARSPTRWLSSGTVIYAPERGQESRRYEKGLTDAAMTGREVDRRQRPFGGFAGLGGTLVGAAVPLLVAGRATFAAALILAVLAALAAPGREALFALSRVRWRDPLVLAPGAMLASWFASALGSPDPSQSFSAWGKVLGLLLVALLLYRFLATHAEARRAALKTLVAAALILAALALVGRYALPALLGLLRARGWVEVDAVTAIKAYGSAAACLLPVTVWAGFRLGGSWRILGTAYIPLAGLVMLGGQSHAGMFGALVAVLMVLAALALSPGPGLLGAIAAIWATLFGFVAVVLVQIPPLPDPVSLPPTVAVAPFELGFPADLLDPHRQMIWGFARDRALEAPWLGHGPDVSNFLPGAHTIVQAFNQEFIPGHPHNWMIELFLETGALGLLAILAALAVLLGRLAMPAVSRIDRAAGLGLFGAFWGSFFFNFSFWSSWWQASFLLLLALVMAESEARAGRTAP